MGIDQSAVMLCGWE